MSKNLKVLIGERDLRFNACLDQWTSLADAHPDGFKRAAEILLEYFLRNIESAANERDTLIFPILFLFRHYLEIRFKEIISNAKRLLGESGELQSGHDLQILWKMCLAVCNEIYDSGIEDYDMVELINKTVHDLSQLDPTSQSFRYPTDLKGNFPFGQEVISLRILNAIFKRAVVFLENISTDLSIMNDNLKYQ